MSLWCHFMKSVQSEEDCSVHDFQSSFLFIIGKSRKKIKPEKAYISQASFKSHLWEQMSEQMSLKSVFEVAYKICGR